MNVRSRETHTRSWVKAVTYRCYQSFIVTPIIGYVLTGNTLFAFKLGLLEFFVKIPAYYLFERVWSLIPHGYKVVKED